MGTLVARHYPTSLFANLADHTYVECGNGGKGWSCWGGKQGGALLRSAQGSTNRADAIAGPKERAGITCYLLNGVCHQAANRILIPAGITVDGARGYGLSVALFGVFGRPRAAFGLCRAPLDTHPGISGDLAECSGSPGDADPAKVPRSGPRDYEDPGYLDRVRSIVSLEAAEPATDVSDDLRSQMDQFELFVRHRFATRTSLMTASRMNSLMRTRQAFGEARLEAEQAFERNEDWRWFNERFDALTVRFQDGVLDAIGPESFTTLLEQPAEERLVLADPDAMERSYGAGGGRPRPGP